MLKRTGLKIEPCRTPVLAGSQPDVVPFTVTLCSWPVSWLFTYHGTQLSSCVDILFRRIHVLFNILINDLNKGSEFYLQQFCRWHQTGKCGSQTTESWWYLYGVWQEGEMNQQEFRKFNKCKSPGRNSPGVSIYPEDHLVESMLAWKDFRGKSDWT